jgi:hypothetical protein
MAEPLSLRGTSWPKPQETGFRVTRQSKIDKSLAAFIANTLGGHATSQGCISGRGDTVCVLSV